MDSLAEYVVSVGGRSRKVRLLRANHKNTALTELDGRVIEITFSNSIGFDEQTSISVNGKNYRVKLSKNDRLLALDVEVDGKLFVLQLEAKRRELDNKTSIAIVSPSYVPKREKLAVKKHGAVTSLMPGKVVLLKVKTGDKVKAGDPLCVLEAMKMENEIIAPRDGTITQVKVEQGSTVNKSDVLVVIE
jgi:biotin carboxyl carrier protein